MNQKTIEIDPMEMIRDIRTATRTVVRELNLLQGGFQGSSLNYTQCHVLFELECHGSLRTTELSEILLLDKSTISKVIKSLVKMGFVRINPDKSDRRQKWLRLTTKGQQKTRENNCQADAEVNEALNLLSEEEATKIRDGLQLYAKAIHRKRRQAECKIRPILAEDEIQVAQLIKTVMAEFGIVGEGYSSNDAEIEHMYTAYANERSVFFVIERSGRILGGGGIGPLAHAQPDICELRKMYFYPELRGLGLGKKLVEMCLNEARKIGYQECYLETVERMWQANLLYQKMGFRRLEHRRGDTGHCSCELYYGLTL